MTNTDRGQFDQADYDRRFHGDFMYDATLEDDDNGGGRSPLFIILTALVLAAFGAVVWVAYQQGVKQGDRGAPQVIAREPGPVRVAPEDPGGVTVPDQDKLIYDRIAGAESAATVEETLAPPPEKPQDLPPPVDAQAEKAKAAATAGAATTPPADPVTPGTAEAGDAAIAAEAESAAPTPEQLAAQAEAKKQAAALTSQIEAIDPGAADAAAKTASAANGAFVVQVGAFKADAEAAAKWQELKRKHGDMLGTLKPDILRVDLGSKGIWYRLRVGPFETRANAIAKCEVLKSRGVACMVQSS